MTALDSRPADSLLRRALRRLGEDFGWAFADFLMNGVGGSIWVPRVVRRALYMALGSSMGSSPGTRFRFAGKPKLLTIGRDVYFNQQVFIEGVAPVTIGDECAMGQQVMILTSHHDIDERGRWAHEATGRPVVIGDRVWIGARATILPGAVIEDDVIIASGAVVTGRCLARSVYGGVPAKRIRDYSAMNEQEPIR